MARRKETLGDLSRYSVNVPMDDFLKIAEMAKNMDAIKVSLKRIDDQYVAMMQIYREMLNKIAEMQKLL